MLPLSIHCLFLFVCFFVDTVNLVTSVVSLFGQEAFESKLLLLFDYREMIV